MVSRFFVPEVHPPIVSTVATSRPLPGSAVVRGPRADCTWQIHATTGCLDQSPVSSSCKTPRFAQK